MALIWTDTQQTLARTVAALLPGQFVIVENVVGLPDSDLPYAQAARSVDGWYCEVVSDAFLPAPVWPIDELALRRLGWSPPDPAQPDDNWSTELPLNADIAKLLLEGLRKGRCCPDDAPLRWSVGTFPSGPDGGLPLDADLPSDLDLAA